MSTATLELRLTPWQVQEIEHGLCVDRDEDRPPWGLLAIGHSPRGGSLEVWDADAALYRLTSLRDIALDGENAAGGRSLQGLIDKIVAHVGIDTLDPETRRWL